jgi:uncharacterized protein with FMN-binding domain
MRRVALAVVSTAAALVALLSFKTHSGGLAAPPAAISTADPSGTASAAGADGTGTSAAAPAAPSGPSSSASSTGTRTVTGDSADTRWGPVQVRITVTNGKVTSAEAVVYPTENGRDQEINAYAIPELNQEAVSAGTADIDAVSGATYTSDGYKTSLQSALDQAGL